MPCASRTAASDKMPSGECSAIVRTASDSAISLSSKSFAVGALTRHTFILISPGVGWQETHSRCHACCTSAGHQQWRCWTNRHLTRRTSLELGYLPHNFDSDNDEHNCCHLLAERTDELALERF